MAAADDLIDRLRRNDPEDNRVFIVLGHFRNQNQVAATAQALHGNEFVTQFVFYYFNKNEDLLHFDWEPLLHELATREKLEFATIDFKYSGHLAPLFRNQLLRSLQLNDNLRSVELLFIDFANNMLDGFVSFLDGAQGLTNLTFSCCGADISSNAGRRIAMALQRSNRIESLELDECEASFLCPFFQCLTSSSNASSHLKKLTFQYPGTVDEELEPIAKALQQYLESADATLQQLKLKWVYFGEDLGASFILNGLSRNTSVTELTFYGCDVRRSEPEEDDDDNVDVEEDVQDPEQELANFFRSRTDLKALQIDCCNILDFASISAAVAEIRLQRFCMKKISFSLEEAQEASLLQAVRMVKATDLAFWFIGQPRQEFIGGLLLSLRNNYYYQHIICKIHISNKDLLNGADKAQLEFYSDRNRKLSEWTENPELVPPELWSYALNLALQAGINPLFQSLMALSGQGVGLKKHSRKRKHPRHYDTSL